MQPDHTDKSANTSTDAAALLYALERAVENAEYHLMMAEEQLLLASRTQQAAQAANAMAADPAFYQRINSRLEKTLACMNWGHKSC